jgi:hypothetical protein
MADVLANTQILKNLRWQAGPAFVLDLAAATETTEDRVRDDMLRIQLSLEKWRLIARLCRLTRAITTRDKVEAERASSGVDHLAQLRYLFGQ